MRGEYQFDDSVRSARRLGWTITGLILLLVVLALAWKIGQVSEQRMLQATREHLSSSLNSLIAEQVAKNKVVDAAWRSTNPFVLLRWQQDNYCGEWRGTEELERGCWYWLPQHAWILYRQRFTDEWANQVREVRAWRLSAIPANLPIASHSEGTGFALELEEISAADVSAAGY